MFLTPSSHPHHHLVSHPYQTLLLTDDKYGKVMALSLLPKGANPSYRDHLLLDDKAEGPRYCDEPSYPTVATPKLGTGTIIPLLTPNHSSQAILTNQSLPIHGTIVRVTIYPNESILTNPWHYYQSMALLY